MDAVGPGMGVCVGGAESGMAVALSGAGHGDGSGIGPEAAALYE